MRLNFQKSIASSQATLPVVGVMAFVLWFVLPVTPHPSFFSDADYGLWRYVPVFLQEGYWSVGISLFCAFLAIYFMAELNNANVLLRVSSRMLSSMLAILLVFAVGCHGNQPGNVVMVLSLLSFFPLFATYQLPSPLLSFITYLILSSASLVFPKLLWMLPVYWSIQGSLRAFTLRCFMASLLASLLPYWFYGGIAFLTGSVPVFVEHVLKVTEFQWFDYSLLDMREVLVYTFVALLFISGTIDFYVHQYLDKTRTRLYYKSLIMYGIYVLIFIAVQPQYFWTLLPLLLLSTAVIFGHFFTLTHTRFSHIYCLVLMVLALAVMAVWYVCDAHLIPSIIVN